ncbi:MAG: tetratricopeptide repeat protein [Burkholderiaceae bacterium]
MVSFFGDPLIDLDAAIAADPAWCLAQVMKADFILTLTEPAMLPQARSAIEAARPLLAHAHQREQGHFAAAELALAGRWRDACALWDAALRENPRDLLALSCAHLFDFYRGDARNLRARVARVLPDWRDDDALHPYVLGMYAFGLEECNFHAQAEATGRRAVASQAKVPWAIHAVAHVMEMQGRPAEGAQWLRARHADWAVDNGLSVHNWWHLALFHLESLDTGAALQLYDDSIGGSASSVNLQWLDGAALLWRLQLLGTDVGARWTDLAAAWADPIAHAGYYAFNDVHALMALLGSGDATRADALLRVCGERASLEPPGAAPDNRAMATEVGLPMMVALVDFSLGRMRQCIARLLPLRNVAHHFGGSHAQRDLIDQTLLAAASGGRDPAVGRALLNERRLSKAHTPLTQHWERRVEGTT